MYAALPHVVEGWATATMCSPPSSVVGTGLCMEGIEQNPLVYDLMAELAFRCRYLHLPAFSIFHFRFVSMACLGSAAQQNTLMAYPIVVLCTP